MEDSEAIAQTIANFLMDFLHLMESNISVLKEFEYINLPNFYTNRYEVMLTHSLLKRKMILLNFQKMNLKIIHYYN